MVEGAIINLKTHMKDLKGKAQMEDSDMVTLSKVMKALKNTLGPIYALIRSMWITEEGANEEIQKIQHAMEESLKVAHSRSGGGESSTSFEQCNDGISDKTEAGIEQK